MVAQKKQLQVDELIKFLEQAPSFALVKFEGTSHLTLESLRKELKGSDSKLRVIKNALFQRALNRLCTKKKGLKEIAEKVFPLRESSAVLSLNDDFIAGLSSFYKFAKKETSLSFRFGFIDNKLYLTDDLNKLAQLQSHDQLIAKVIGALNAPASRLLYSMQFNINKLVYVLKTKGGETN